MISNNYDNSQALSGSNHLQKLLLPGLIYCGALVPSGPLGYCFGMATTGKPSTKFPLGELEGQEPPPPINFSCFLENAKIIAGGAPALRVPRAENWLTVFRSLPYQNSS